MITLTQPEPDEKKVILIPDNKKIFSFKGKVRDDNLIKLITVNNVVMTYDKNAMNPSFSGDADVQNADNIIVRASDLYDNVAADTLSIFRTESQPPVITLKTPFATPDNEIFLEMKESPMDFFQSTILKNMS